MSNPNNPCGGKYGKSIDVKFVNECNGHCAFCIEKDGYCPSNFSVEKMARSINSLHRHNNVLILGGEPMLKPDLLIDLLSRLDGKKNIYVTTNCTPISDAKCKEIAQYLLGINFSIMHHNVEKNKQIMGVSTNPDTLKRMIAIYKDNCVTTRLNCNLMKGGIDNLQDAIYMMEYAQYLGFDEVRFAELQDNEDLFIQAKYIFEGVHNNPFEDGCEQVMTFPYHFSGNVTIRSTCGLCNKLAPMPKERNPKVEDTTRVVYCDGGIFTSWRKPNKIKVKSQPLSRKEKKTKEYSRKSSGCHTSGGCHGY